MSTDKDNIGLLDRRRAGVPALALLIILVVNVLVSLLPDGQYRRQFDASIQVARKMGKDAEIVLFGDSRATMYRSQHFSRPTLSFAAPNNTIIFSRLLFEKMLAECSTRPRIVFLMMGANNYNKNGLFPLRDFAIRRLVSYGDIAHFTQYKDGHWVALDALFARAFPVYGRRMEIRSPRLLLSLWRQSRVPISQNNVLGMRPLTGADEAPPRRSSTEDKNYWLIYKRSIYINYKLSGVHTGTTEALIDQALKVGAKVVLVQPPVEPMMRELEKKMVGTVFDDYLADLKKRKPVHHLDMRDVTRYEFADLNHISIRGGAPRRHRGVQPPRGSAHEKALINV